MLEQRVFEWVAAHLIHQNARAYSDHRAVCMYRTFTGLKCAVGSLITSENYDAEFDCTAGMSASAEPIREALSRSLGIPEEKLPHTGFLVDLQALHDDVPLEYWPAELVEFARNYNLATPGWLTEKANTCA